MGAKNKKDDEVLKDFLERISHLIKLYDSYAEFARVVNISRQVPTMIINGDIKNLSFNLINKIVRGTGCNANWLLTGKGGPFDKRDDDLKTKEALVSIDSIFETFKDGKVSKDKVVFIKSIRDLCDVYLSQLQKDQSD